MKSWISRRTFLKLTGAGALGCGWPIRTGFATESSADSVILLSAPSMSDRYYRDYFQDLLPLYARMVRACHPGDFPVVVVNTKTRPKARELIPPENLLIGNIPDIWIRDFAPVRTRTGAWNFRYRPDYLSRADAEFIEHGFDRWMRSAGLSAEPAPLVLDGGNLVHNGADRAVTTERVLKDNPSVSPDEILAFMRERMGLEQVAILPEEEGDVTGHADGMVTWLTPDRLGVAAYEEPFRSVVRARLEKGLGDIEVVELPYEPSDEVWKGTPSASGVYVNALNTRHAVYVPAYGLDADPAAAEIFRAQGGKPVISIPVGREAALGGSLRCLSWDLDGPDARTIRSLAGCPPSVFG